MCACGLQQIYYLRLRNRYNNAVYIIKLADFEIEKAQFNVA